MSLAWPTKDPDEVLDYHLDWSKRVVNDKITASEWIVPEGIVKAADEFADQMTTVWLSGGTVGQVYSIVNRVTTDVGRRMDQTVTLTIREK